MFFYSKHIFTALWVVLGIVVSASGHASRLNTLPAVSDAALPLHQSKGSAMAISQRLKGEADELRRQQRGEDALARYAQAIFYLPATDEAAQRLRGEIYHQMGQVAKHQSRFDLMGRYQLQALAIYTQIDDESLMAQSLKNIAFAELKSKHYLAALDSVLRSLAIQETLEDQQALAEVLMLAGTIYRNLFRYERSLEFVQKAQVIYKRTNNLAKVADCANHIGFLYTRLGQHDMARSFYQVSINMPRSAVLSKTLATAYREIAIIDSDAGEYEQAMAMASIAHTMYTSSNNSEDKGKSAITARIIGRIYAKTGVFAKALEYLDEARTLALEQGSDLNQVKALNALGEALLTQDPARAKQYLQQSVALAISQDFDAELATAYRYLVHIAQSEGNFREAFSLSNKLIDVIERIHAEQETNKHAFAKAKLESHKMETELDALRERVKIDQLEIFNTQSEIELVRQANKIANLELTKNRYGFFLLALALLASVIFGFYIWRGSVASRHRNRELDYLASHDALTECFNRRALFDKLNSDFCGAIVPGEYSVIMADVDRFKAINDNYGHCVGDNILKSVATLMKSAIGQTDMLARYGGEEFCIVLPDTTLSQAIHKANQLRISIADWDFDGVRVTCSFGVAVLNSEVTTPNKLIAQADTALYVSKSEGRNRVTWWTPSMTR